MDKLVDEIVIRISGDMPYEEKLEIDQDVQITLKGQVVKEQAGSNQDGSVNLRFIIKPEVLVELKKIGS